MNNRLRELRAERGLSQRGLAVLARVSPGLLVMCERRGYIPSDAMRQKLAQALQVSQRDIWSGVKPNADRPTVQ